MALTDYLPTRLDASVGRLSPKKGTLAAVVGIGAAGMLLQLIPADESGRKVEATIAADGTATIHHVAGPQYLKTYLDIVGVPTACDGITRKDKVRLGKTFTEAECGQLLEEELIRHAEPVMKCTPGLNKETMPFQIVAAVSHAYNFGPAAYCGSSIARNYNAGNVAAACEAFLLWSKAGGRVVRGLVRRRNRERQYCLTDIVPGATPANLPARLAPWR